MQPSVNPLPCEKCGSQDMRAAVTELLTDPRTKIHGGYRLIGEQCECGHVNTHKDPNEMMLNVDERPMEFWYTNWRAEYEKRLVKPISIRYGTSEWHTKPQWLLAAYDFDKKGVREFAMKDMRAVAYL